MENRHNHLRLQTRIRWKVLFCKSVCAGICLLIKPKVTERTGLMIQLKTVHHDSKTIFASNSNIPQLLVYPFTVHHSCIHKHFLSIYHIQRVC